ncbi:MAG: LacI family DNA-binding transcriptional regulator [Limimaricola sp.]|uniref:LacI family DNA-binding transcriptional regulator n=1 Tax=Limimaricola sp. TaxID=2211665 RepID=UPI001D3A452E|nr:LacI family DNA-binding transcriptional regulator [Limimaricola sp.]MBI1416477.1 LacI family DNA-binding transcriptional regulator [Limimaricola sp.]
MAVTLREVAEKAGVSPSAVSRSFTEGASVSAATRAKVMKAAHALGYHPNALAAGLTTGKTRLVGLVANNFHNPFYLEVFDLFTRGLQAEGLRPLLVNLSDDLDPALSLRMLRQYSVDAAIVASSTLPTSFAAAYRAAGVPVLHCFARASDQPDVDVVGINNAAAGRLAAETFVARGYARAGFLGGPQTATSTQDRRDGFLAAAERLGLETSVAHAANYSFEAGRAAMQDLIARGPAEVYFCGDDVISIGALSALRDAGLRVPEDVGLLGVNDMEMAGWNGIDLTTIRQPIDQIVAASIDQVTAIMRDPGRPPEMRLFGCQIVERATLRPVR